MRTIQDRDLQLWEVFASAGEFGYPDRANMVFHCLTDPGRRARVVQRDRGKAEVESETVRLPEEELVALLERTVEVK